jgi:hypothetical protein
MARNCHSPWGQCPACPRNADMQATRTAGRAVQITSQSGRPRAPLHRQCPLLNLPFTFKSELSGRAHIYRCAPAGHHRILLEKPRISCTQTRRDETIMAGIKQTTSGHYLKRENLQELLEELFPGETDFDITVCLMSQRGFTTVDSRRMNR